MKSIRLYFLLNMGSYPNRGREIQRISLETIERYIFNIRSSSSSTSCARSVADIGDHGLPTLSVVSSHDELIVGRFFSCYEIIQTVCVFCLPLLLVPHIFPLNICFSSPLHLFICPKNCSCLFLMVLSRDLLYPAIYITSSFDLFSVHDILIILLMYHISAASSLLSRSFVNVQHSHPYRRMDHV